MAWHDFFETAKQHIAWMVAGLVGRLIFHSREVQAGRRRFWGKELPFELLIAVGMSFVGKAMGGWFGLSGDLLIAAAGVSAYLGPRAIDILFDRILASRVK